MRPARLLALLLSVLLAWSAHAKNELNRCTGADGTSIFTDKKCEDIGAVPRTDPPPVAGNVGDGGNRLKARSCARRPEDLLYGIESAINAADVNELAAFYHWPGISSSESVAIFKRLQVLIAHPLLSIDLLYPPAPHDDYGYEILVGGPPRQAYAVQVTVKSASDSTPIRSTLSLLKNVGCWWMQF